MIPQPEQRREPVDIPEIYTPRADRVLARAHEFALERGAVRVGVEHLLLAILDDGDSVATVAISNVASLRQIGTELVRLLDSQHYSTPAAAQSTS